jgi:hypothetical protein
MFGLYLKQKNHIIVANIFNLKLTFNIQPIISYYSVQFFEINNKTVDFYNFYTKLRTFIGYLLLM